MKLLLVLALCVAPSLSARMPYVVGGIQVDSDTKYPFMATLVRGSDNMDCGGTLIAAEWVLTAAHCFGKRIDYIAFGKLHVSDDVGSPLYIAPIGYMKHQNYLGAGPLENFPYDIGVIRLQTSALASMRDGDVTVATIPLLDAGIADGDLKDCVIMGWGHIKSGVLPGDTPERLHEGNVNVFSQDYCKGKWSSQQILDSHVCVGVDKLISACSNDGGGPLVCTVGDTATLVGVMSFTQFSCGPGVPSVYTRVASYRDWITDITCDAA